MSISLNMKANFVNMFRLFRISFANFASNLINISVNYNTKINLIKFLYLLCVNNSSFDDNVDLFYNVDNNVIFNDETFS